MIAGEPYNPLDPERERRRSILSELLGSGADTAWIHLGTRVFFNFNCIVLDVCELRVGDHTLFGSGVQILTPLHPMNPALRREQEFGKPIEIGSDVWVGAGALI